MKQQMHIIGSISIRWRLDQCTENLKEAQFMLRMLVSHLLRDLTKLNKVNFHFLKQQLTLTNLVLALEKETDGILKEIIS